MEMIDESTEAPRRGGRKPCRVCKKKHQGVYEREPGSGEWHVRVFHLGRVVRRKVGPHGVALKVHAKWRVEIAEGRFLPKQVAATDELLVPAFAAYFDRRDDLDASWKSVAKWWREAPELRGKTVRDLTADDVEAARKRLVAAGRAPSTWNGRHSLLHAFYEDYEDRRRRKRPHTPPVPNPVRGTRLTEENQRTRYLTDDEEARLREALPDPVDWTIVQLALHSALRRGNAFGLRWTTDVNLASRVVRGWSRKGRKKLLRERWVPVNDDLLAALRALPSRGRSEWLFPNVRGTGPLDAKKWYVRVFKPALERAGIEDFHFHDLRHTAATRLRARGVPVEDIAVVLGHADDRMAQRYAHMAPGRLHDVMQKLCRTDTGTDTGRNGGGGDRDDRVGKRSSGGHEMTGRYWDRTSGPRLVRPMLSR